MQFGDIFYFCLYLDKFMEPCLGGILLSKCSEKGEDSCEWVN